MMTTASPEWAAGLGRRPGLTPRAPCMGASPAQAWLTDCVVRGAGAGSPRHLAWPLPWGQCWGNAYPCPGAWPTLGALLGEPWGPGVHWVEWFLKLQLRFLNNKEFSKALHPSIRPSVPPLFQALSLGWDWSF